jgi:hypothetical protein
MLRWIRNVMSRKALGLNDDERQNLTTLSLMLGEVALTVAIGLLVYVLRYSWPDAIIAANATVLISGLFNVVYGLLILMGIQIAAKAAIAVGGKIKAAFGGASVEAEQTRD